MEGAMDEKTSIEELISWGLVARLSLQSMITGQLFVELSYDSSGRYKDYSSAWARTHIPESPKFRPSVPP